MKEEETSSPRTKSICLPCEQEAHYMACVDDPLLFRHMVDSAIEQYPELFPAGIGNGYYLHDSYNSIKEEGLRLRRIKLKEGGHCYLLRPSTVLPYLVAKTDDIEKALYLRRWGVPFEALSYVFGRDAMFYYRAWVSMGRNSLVGTTVKSVALLPKDILADEKHTWIEGEKCFVATTVGGGCLLGAALVEEASAEALTKGYGEYLQEAQEIKAEYEPESVCTDGWSGTREAWRMLVPAILLIRCFLHSVLKIESRCRGAIRREVSKRAWHIYHAEGKRQFAQRIRRFREWGRSKLEGAVKAAVMKLCELKEEFIKAYDYPEAARTSNGIDRLMDYQDRVLYSMRYLHGEKKSGRLAVRAMALSWNFHPYSKRAQEGGAKRSPFEELNGFQYQENWLKNYLCAASMGGHRL